MSSQVLQDCFCHCYVGAVVDAVMAVEATSGGVVLVMWVEFPEGRSCGREVMLAAGKALAVDGKACGGVAGGMTGVTGAADSC